MACDSSIRRLLVGAFFFWFSLYTYPSFLSAYSSEALSATPMIVGIIVGSYGLTQMVLRIPLGLWSDMIRRRKPFLAMGMGASLLSGAGFALTRSAAGAIVFRGLAGVAAATWVTYTALYSAYFSQQDTARAMGRMTSLQYGAQLAAMLLGAYLAQALSEEVAFWLASAAALAGFITVLSIEDAPIVTPPQTLRTLLSVVRDRSLLLSTALTTLFQFISWGTVMGFTINWARDVVGLSTTQLGLLSAAYLLPSTLVSQWSGGALSDRMGQRAVLGVGYGLIAMACLLFAHAQTAVLLFTAQAAFGLGMGLTQPINVSGSIRNIDPARRGAAIGFYQSVYGIGMFLGPVLSGALIERFSAGVQLTAGYIANFYGMACIAVLCVLISVMLGRGVLPGRGKN